MCGSRNHNSNRHSPTHETHTHLQPAAQYICEWFCSVRVCFMRRYELKIVYGKPLHSSNTPRPMVSLRFVWRRDRNSGRRYINIYINIMLVVLATLWRCIILSLHTHRTRCARFRMCLPQTLS